MEWNDGMENGMENGMEQSKSNYLASVSLGLLSHHRSFMIKFGTARHRAFISKHVTVASSSSGALLL